MVVYSHGACFLPPASGEAVSDLLVKPDEPSWSGFLPGSAQPGHPAGRVPCVPWPCCAPHYSQCHTEGVWVGCGEAQQPPGITWSGVSTPRAACLESQGGACFGASPQIPPGRLCWPWQRPQWLGEVKGCSPGRCLGVWALCDALSHHCDKHHACQGPCASSVKPCAPSTMSHVWCIVSHVPRHSWARCAEPSMAQPYQATHTENDASNMC